MKGFAVFLSWSIGLTVLSWSQYAPLFILGEDDNRHQPFGREAGPTVATPTELVRDDFYFLPGTYPGVGTLTDPEPIENFERSLTSWDPATTIYFTLTPAQAVATGELKMRLDFLWSGESDDGAVENQIAVTVNGGEAIYTTPLFDRYQVFDFSVPTADLKLTAGANHITITRVGTSANTWLAMDQIAAWLDPTYNLDSDEDGLPLYWERQFLLSDDDAGDAATDYDRDGLTALQEFQKGTIPNLADTDGDGLSDASETATNPRLADTDGDGLLDGEEEKSDPTLADSDNDGASDSLEVLVGSDPGVDSSRPPTFSSSIGLNFRSAARRDIGIWPKQAATGLVPQTNWNHTDLLRQYGVRETDPLLTATTTNIASPTPGTLVDAAGLPTPVTIDLAYDGCYSNDNRGSAVEHLLGGYLRPDDERPATVTLNAIPYERYQIIAYISGDYHGADGSILLASQSDTTIKYQVAGTAPIDHFILPNQRVVDEEDDDEDPTPYFNTLVFDNLGGATQTLQLNRSRGSNGLAGLQIIDLDSDSNGNSLPDAWEMRYRLPGNAADDPDGDGLSNKEELAFGSDPRLADTDGDGLNDKMEQAAGTDPLFADSDRDGLSDAAELQALLPSNPVKKDSDDDGVEDGEERRRFSDPLDGEIRFFPPPTNTASQFLWEMTDIWLLVDNEAMDRADGNLRSNLLDIIIQEASPNETKRTIRFELEHMEGRVVVDTDVDSNLLRDGRDRGFNLQDYETDHRQKLGLSGVGRADLSDPFTMRIQATPETEGEGWRIVAEIVNQRTGGRVFQKVIQNGLRKARLEGATVWNYRDKDYPTVTPGSGVQVFRTTTDLRDNPRFLTTNDVDHDGLPDVWETRFGFDPLVANGAGDFDNDGLTTVQEYLLGTDPKNPDSDGDGTNDGLEFSQHSNPAVADSVPALANQVTLAEDQNGNGISDLFEAVTRRSNPFVIVDPDADPDGDGASNHTEAAFGTDASNPLSVPQLNLNLTAEGKLRLSSAAFPGKDISVKRSDDLDVFSPIVGSMNPTLTGLEMTLDMPEKVGFFRMEARDRDSDSDGLSDWAEAMLGTDPQQASTARRAGLRDADGDGQTEIDRPGDLLAFADLFANAENLRNGTSGTDITPAQASRLLLQASFGPTDQSVLEVQKNGITGWIDRQMNEVAPTLHRPYLEEITSDFLGARVNQRDYRYNTGANRVESTNLQSAFARAAIHGEDQLRQRVAFALSQILVVSRLDADVNARPIGLANYYDLLVKHAFGNYEDLLYEVTLSPIMGLYLSHLGNAKADPEKNRFPDENYAREVMQLFAIGLWELNPDGTRKVGADGQNIPTYNLADITEVARVFTGLWYGKQRWRTGSSNDEGSIIPMSMNPRYHDYGQKRLPGGLVLPARDASEENALLDVRDTIRHLVKHPSCAPFISKSLIQFLVTSNPSPAYVERISRVFSNDGTGVTGNLAAVIKAILLDPEARDPAQLLNEEFGLLREPVIRVMHLGRLLDLGEADSLLWWDYGSNFGVLQQMPLNSPSVFNFYRPDFSPNGTLTDRRLAAPAFGILSSYTSASLPNFLWQVVETGFQINNRYHFPPSLQKWAALASHDPAALVDRLNLLVCAGTLRPTSRQVIIDALKGVPENNAIEQARLALYLMMMTPEGAVQR